MHFIGYALLIAKIRGLGVPKISPVDIHRQCLLFMKMTPVELS